MICQPPVTIFNPPINGLCDPADQGDECERRRERERDREPKFAAVVNRIILSTPLLLPIFKIPPPFEKPDPASPLNYYLRPDFAPPLGFKTKPRYGD